LDVVATASTKRFGLAIELAQSTRWFAGTAVPELNESGEVESVLAVTQDVTALHRTRADFESAELRFRRLTEGSPDLISQHGPDGTFQFASRAAYSLTQREPEALVGTSIAELIHQEDRDKVVSAIQRAANGEPERLVTFRLLRPDGSIRWCELTAQTAVHGQGAAPITCVTRDITARIRTEEILRAASRMEATATLAAGVAHDFNNLMTSILGNAELLLTDPSFPDGPSRLNQVAESAKRGGALAQQLLAYARGGKYQTQTVSVNDVVKQALHLQKHALPPRIQLEADLDPSSPAIEADPVQIGQVVTNLCINGAEAIPGIGRLTVRTRLVELDQADVAGKPGLQPGPAVLLQVSDSGSGIDPAVLPRIFEPFFSTKFQGRGLGLAAAYGIVKNHRGYIGVESETGRGTTFSAYFPAVEPLPARPPVAAEPFPTGDETILLVDDDDAVIDVTSSILEKLQYRVLVARHGIEAVEIARTHPDEIHLVILDLGMPLAGGAEAYPFLKAARPDVKIMISSGYEMNEVVQGLLAAGADAFLQKPYRVSALARGIRRVLERKVAAGRLED
jgi:PAS domain S-box-containing protein